MERERQEKMKKVNDDGLTKIIEKGGQSGIEATKESFRRAQEGKTIPKECLMASLRLRSKGPYREKEVEELKAKAAKILAEDILEEEDLLTILREVESQRIRERVVRKYQAENKQFSDRLLMEIIRRVPALVEEMGWILLKQTTKSEALQIIEEEAEGTLQMAAFKKHGKRGRSLDDACYNIGFVPTLAEPTWEELCQKERTKKLSLEQLDREIIQYTDSLRIREEAREIVLEKAKEKCQRLEEKIKVNPKDTKARMELQELKELIEKLEEGGKKSIREKEMLISTALQT